MLRHLTLALLAFTLLLGACGYNSDDNEVGGVDAATETEDEFPPSSIETLAAEFDPQLAPLGLHVTYGGVFDRSDGGYLASPTGEHLALYVEPIEDSGYDTADYVEGLGTVTALITPQVFERWSGIETYDICQEPPAIIDARDAPAPYTQIDISRAVSDTVDWETATTETVIALGLDGETRVVVTPVIREHPDYVAAEQAAA
jgi:hypothetical protein